MSGLKILIISNLCPPFLIGGYEIGCANMTAALHAAGHDVRLATCPSHISGLVDSPYVDRCFTLQWFQPVAIPDGTLRRYQLFHAAVSDYCNTRQLLQLLRSFAPDIVYVWNVWGIGGIALLDLLNILHVPWVLHLMDNLPHHLVAGGPAHVRNIFGGSIADLLSHGRIISMSQRLVDEVFEDFQITFDGGFDVVPGWVDTRALPNKFRDGRNSNIRFLSAARVSEQKGVEFILDAAVLLLRGGVKDFCVDVYGMGELPRYIDLAQCRGVHQVVRFLGQRTQAELFTLFPDYDAFLFPTEEREPFGFAPIEAAAAGCVPILTRQCGAAERLVDLAHCLKIDRNAEELAHAMRQIIERTIDLPAIAQRASKMVCQDLALDRALCKVVTILKAAVRDWDKEAAYEDWLPLLIHTKHYLACAMMFGE